MKIDLDDKSLIFRRTETGYSVYGLLVFRNDAKYNYLKLLGRLVFIETKNAWYFHPKRIFGYWSENATKIIASKLEELNKNENKA